MTIYLVQHAEAKRKEEDPTRPLSEKGLSDIDKISQFLRGKEIRVSRILHSGRLRAKQTAEKLGEVISSLEEVKETDGLAPLDDPNIWGERLRGDVNDVMLVGHLPHLSRLAALLLTDDPNHEVIRFGMSGVICLAKGEEGSWSIQWMVIPQIT